MQEAGISAGLAFSMKSITVVGVLSGTSWPSWVASAKAVETLIFLELNLRQSGRPMCFSRWDARFIRLGLFRSTFQSGQRFYNAHVVVAKRSLLLKLCNLYVTTAQCIYATLSLPFRSQRRCRCDGRRSASGQQCRRCPRPCALAFSLWASELQLHHSLYWVLRSPCTKSVIW